MVYCPWNPTWPSLNYLSSYPYAPLSTHSLYRLTASVSHHSLDFNSSLAFIPHIQSIVKSCCFFLYNIARIGSIVCLCGLGQMPGLHLGISFFDYCTSRPPGLCDREDVNWSRGGSPRMRNHPEVKAPLNGSWPYFQLLLNVNYIYMHVQYCPISII